MNILFQSNLLEYAKKYLEPAKNSEIIIEHHDNNIKVNIGDFSLKRGAVETIFELFCQLDIGAFSASVAASLLATWLWEKFKLGKEDNNKKLSIEIKSNDSYIKVNLNSKKELADTIKVIIDNDTRS